MLVESVELLYVCVGSFEVFCVVPLFFGSRFLLKFARHRPCSPLDKFELSSSDSNLIVIWFDVVVNSGKLFSPGLHEIYGPNGPSFTLPLI